MRRCRSAVLAVGFAVGLGLASGLSGIGQARADNPAYLNTLHDAGINTPRGEYELKEWGWEVCELRARGKPPRQWVEQSVFQDALHPPYGLSIDQANFIVDTAVKYLCDDRDGPPPWEPLP
jgi:hypothetical protein